MGIVELKLDIESIFDKKGQFEVYDCRRQK